MDRIKAFLKKALPKRIVELLKEYNARLECTNYYVEPVVGKVGIEIGGPSDLFQYALPVYKYAAVVDGVNFANATHWEGKIDHESGYKDIDGKRLGDQFISEASDLKIIKDESYDFAISSNCLEHVANPLKALTEMRRITKQGGYILLALPRKEGNFDRRRKTTLFEHLVDDFKNGTTEHDLTHLEEIMDFHDFSMDPGVLASVGPVDLEQIRAQFRRLAENNFKNRFLHHHTFDAENIRKMFEFVGIPIVRQDTSARTNKYLTLGKIAHD